MNEDIKALQTRYGEFVEAVSDTLGKPTALLQAEGLVEVARWLKDELQYDYLACITGVDYPDRGETEVVYNLWSYPKGRHLVLKVRCPRREPTVPSLAGVWRSADWLERETYDLVGVRFEGHPDLRRILLPEGWRGHPLRKDYDMSVPQYVSKGPDGRDVVSLDEGEGW